MSFYIGFSLRLLPNFVGRANSQAGFSNFLLFPLAAWGSRLPLSPVSNSGCTEAVLFWASSCGGSPYPVWVSDPSPGGPSLGPGPTSRPRVPTMGRGSVLTAHPHGHGFFISSAQIYPFTLFKLGYIFPIVFKKYFILFWKRVFL